VYYGKNIKGADNFWAPCAAWCAVMRAARLPCCASCSPGWKSSKVSSILILPGKSSGKPTISEYLPWCCRAPCPQAFLWSPSACIQKTDWLIQILKSQFCSDLTSKILQPTFWEFQPVVSLTLCDGLKFPMWLISSSFSACEIYHQKTHIRASCVSQPHCACCVVLLYRQCES